VIVLGDFDFVPAMVKLQQFVISEASEAHQECFFYETP